MKKKTVIIPGNGGQLQRKGIWYLMIISKNARLRLCVFYNFSKNTLQIAKKVL